MPLPIDVDWKRIKNKPSTFPPDIVKVKNTVTLSVSASERVFSNAALNIAVAAGDYIEIKGVQPTWATNPATTIYGGYIYIE
jgi:hypothetical protein